MLRRIILPLTLLLSPLTAAEAPALSAAQYVAAMKAAGPQGGVLIKADMTQTDAAGAKKSLKVQIKRRELGAGKSEHLYQVVYPRDRRGEGVLLRIQGSSFSGAEFIPGKGVTPLKAADRHRPLLGTDLTVDDLMADFLDWSQQSLTGEEVLENTPCAIVESLQGNAKVKNWVDKKRYVTLKAEIYPTGGSNPTRTVHSIEARRSDSGFYVPVKFSVSTTATGTTTRVEGTGFDSEIPYTDADFTEAALQQVTPAPAKK
jgi:hypothetical protein